MSAHIHHAAGLPRAVIAIVLTLYVIDRLLLRAEARGWINYRRNGLSRPGALYHTFELHSVFDPGIQQVMEISYEERKAQDYTGDTLKGSDGDTSDHDDSPRALSVQAQRADKPAGVERSEGKRRQVGHVQRPHDELDQRGCQDGDEQQCCRDTAAATNANGEDQDRQGAHERIMRRQDDIVTGRQQEKRAADCMHHTGDPRVADASIRTGNGSGIVA